MPFYTIYFKQTERRTFRCTADSLDEAQKKWSHGDGEDCFEATDDDQFITHIDISEEG